MGSQGGQRLGRFQEAASQDSCADKACIAAGKAAQRQAGNVGEDERGDTTCGGAAAHDEPFDLLTGAAEKAQVTVQFEAEAFDHCANDMSGAVMQLQAIKSAPSPRGEA